MMEKWKERAIHMNFKKAVIIFLVACVVLAVSVPAALYGNFQSRIAAWEQVRETDRERGETEKISREDDESDSDDREWERDMKEGKEGEEKDLEEIHQILRLTWSDLALLAGCAAAGMALGIWYWILCMIWAYRKAHRMGVNGGLAVLAALFFNLAAVAALYLYGMLRGTCANCGRVRSGNGKFCDRCGSPLKRECPQCRQEVSAQAAYCSNCGAKLDESGENKR